MIRRPPRSTQGVASAASDVYKRQIVDPVDKVKQMYETEVLKDETSKGSSANEQSDSSKSD